MGTMASQITSLTIVYSAVYSDADQRKHQSSTSLAFVRGIRRGPVNSPHKWPVTRKMFPFDDVIMVLHIRLKYWRRINHESKKCSFICHRYINKISDWISFQQHTFSASYKHDKCVFHPILCFIITWSLGILNYPPPIGYVCRHDMETFSESLALCEGNPPVTGGFLHKEPVIRNSDEYYDLRLNKQLNKGRSCRWFETPQRSFDVTVMMFSVWHILNFRRYTITAFYYV